MKSILLILLSTFLILPVLAQELIVKDGKAYPVKLVNYPLDKFLNDYARKSGIRVSFSKGTIKKRDKINLSLRKEISLKNLHQYVIKILNNHGLTLTQDSGGWSVINTRDVRYIPVNAFSSDSFPDSNEHITIVHKMKYPLAKSTSRGLRPSLSRYGRVIHFNDNKTIVLNEVGSSSSQLLKIISSLDTEESYNRYLKNKEKKSIEESKKTPKEKSIEELEEKVAKLEREKERFENMAKKQINKKGAKNAE